MLQPGHGKITSVSGPLPATERPIQTRFRYASTPKELKLATDNNSQAHYAKGTQSPHIEAPTACRQLVSHTISLP